MKERVWSYHANNHFKNHTFPKASVHQSVVFCKFVHGNAPKKGLIIPNVYRNLQQNCANHVVDLGKLESKTISAISELVQDDAKEQAKHREEDRREFRNS